MTTVLLLNTTLFTSNARSTTLAEATIAELRKRHPKLEVIRRDFHHQPIPHLTEGAFAAFSGKPSAESPDVRAAVALSDELIAELHAADYVVIGLPMYNFGIPSSLKAWIDHVARAGKTFRYTANGPEGLVEDKPVFVLATRGGRYQGTAADTQTPYLRQILGFMGLRDVRFVYAEGLAMGDAAARAMQAAHADILVRAA